MTLNQTPPAEPEPEDPIGGDEGITVYDTFNFDPNYLYGDAIESTTNRIEHREDSSDS